MAVHLQLTAQLLLINAWYKQYEVLQIPSYCPVELQSHLFF